MMMDPRDRLILALDLPSVAEAEAMIDKLGDSISFYKIGYQLGFAGGLALTRKLAHTVEGVIWRFPSLSMGCRPVVTLPALEEADAKVIAQKTFGVPLWPFYVVQKPA